MGPNIEQICNSFQYDEGFMCAKRYEVLLIILPATHKISMINREGASNATKHQVSNPAQASNYVEFLSKQYKGASSCHANPVKRSSISLHGIIHLR